MITTLVRLFAMGMGLLLELGLLSLLLVEPCDDEECLLLWVEDIAAESLGAKGVDRGLLKT